MINKRGFKQVKAPIYLPIFPLVFSKNQHYLDRMYGFMHSPQGLAHFSYLRFAIQAAGIGDTHYYLLTTLA